jgi:DNA polymerase-3 subunit gamma/tau
VAEPAAAAEPAAPSSGVIDATALRRLWPEVLDAVKRTTQRTRALLDSAQVAQVEGDLVTLSIPAAPIARMASEQRNIDVLVAALTTVFGGTWRVAVEPGAGTPLSGAVALQPGAVAPQPEPEAPPTGPAGRQQHSAPVAGPPVESAPPPDEPPDDELPPPPEHLEPAAPAAPLSSAPTASAPPPGLASTGRPRPPRPSLTRTPAAGQPAAPSLEADPRSNTEPDDPSAPARRPDVEVDALRLLESALGARPIED